MKVIMVVLIALAIVLFMINLADIHRFVKREYTVCSKKISKPLKIALLSDLHGKEFGYDNSMLAEAIKDENPDIIICAGDMVTASNGKVDDSALKLFGALKDYPIYYGIGNHEYRMKIYQSQYKSNYDKYMCELKETGVTVLENNRVFLEEYNVTIQGLMIDREYYQRFEKPKMKPDYIRDITGSYYEDGMEILIAHNPEYFDAYALAGADLVLSGHNHGGIINLPFLGGVVSPRFALFPKYDGGEYEKNDSTMILSRGLGYHSIPVRLFNPGELVIIDVTPCNEEKR